MTLAQREGAASSANACRDPDRQIIDDFERGTPAAGGRMITELAAEDPMNVTFLLRHEDHTLGNALRYVIGLYDDVDFVGYQLPHPSEYLIHLRIQSKGPRTSRQILKQAFHDLHTVYAHLETAFREQASRHSQVMQSQ